MYSQRSESILLINKLFNLYRGILITLEAQTTLFNSSVIYSHFCLIIHILKLETQSLELIFIRIFVRTVYCTVIFNDAAQKKQFRLSYGFSLYDIDFRFDGCRVMIIFVLLKPSMKTALHDRSNSKWVIVCV